MTGRPNRVLKPRALHHGSRIALFAPASPAEALDWAVGKAELVRMGFEVDLTQDFSPVGYFAGPLSERLKGFLTALEDSRVAALVSLRGGYGSSYLLSEHLQTKLGSLPEPKCVIGYSDLTSLQIFLWQMCGWVTFYGPMAAAGFARGAGDLKGFDEQSFHDATGNTKGNWSLNLKGETLHVGSAEGLLLGGCLTMIQTSLGTPWELDTEDSILVLEDTSMKPYLVDRALMHLLQAGKFRGVRGLILGDFPGCEPPVAGGPTVREVCSRILGPLGIPIVYGAPVGHTNRSMLTLPLGIHTRLHGEGEGAIEFLEPAVVP